MRWRVIPRRVNRKLVAALVERESAVVHRAYPHLEGRKLRKALEKDTDEVVKRGVPFAQRHADAWTLPVLTQGAYALANEATSSERRELYYAIQRQMARDWFNASPQLYGDLPGEQTVEVEPVAPCARCGSTHKNREFTGSASLPDFYEEPLVLCVECRQAHTVWLDHLFMLAVEGWDGFARADVVQEAQRAWGEDGIKVLALLLVAEKDMGLASRVLTEDSFRQVRPWIERQLERMSGTPLASKRQVPGPRSPEARRSDHTGESPGSDAESHDATEHEDRVPWRVFHALVVEKTGHVKLDQLPIPRHGKAARSFQNAFRTARKATERWLVEERYWWIAKAGILVKRFSAVGEEWLDGPEAGDLQVLEQRLKEAHSEWSQSSE